MKLIDLINKINSDDGYEIGDLVLEFHQNGSLWYIGNWENGTRHGKWTYFWENGKLECIKNYKYGELLKMTNNMVSGNGFTKMET